VGTPNLIACQECFRLKVVSIGAHPDDLEMGTAGTLAMHRKKGDSIYGILCTLGGIRGDPAGREDEARKAAELLGLRLQIIDYPVNKLNRPSHEFARVLRKYIEDIGPDRVYTHTSFDNHQVHVSVNRSSIEASRDIRQLLTYEIISSTTTDFKPNAFVDITEFIDLKIEALKLHASQYSDRFYIQAGITRSLANVRYVWSKVGSNSDGLAEAFMVHRLYIA
jgi:LmbE family N-acetylglucosaminyl deacetylase